MAIQFTWKHREYHLTNYGCAALARQMVKEIATRGHTVGESQNRAGQVCLLGALGHSAGRFVGTVPGIKPATPYDVMRQLFSQRFVQYLCANYPLEPNASAYSWPIELETAPSTMAIWNDNILKTGEETIAWLNKFADAADAAPAGAPVTEW